MVCPLAGSCFLTPRPDPFFVGGLVWIELAWFAIFSASNISSPPGRLQGEVTVVAEEVPPSVSWAANVHATYLSSVTGR